MGAKSYTPISDRSSTSVITYSCSFWRRVFPGELWSFILELKLASDSPAAKQIGREKWIGGYEVPAIFPLIPRRRRLVLVRYSVQHSNQLVHIVLSSVS